MALAVHPRFGEELTVVSGYGRHAVLAETADGQFRLLPRGWTTLQPRAAPLVLGGRPVHLAPDAVHELAMWVADRARARSGSVEEVGHFDQPMEDRGPHGGGVHQPAEERYSAGAGSAHDAERDSRGVGSAVAVVGEAGSPGARRGARARRARRASR